MFNIPTIVEHKGPINVTYPKRNIALNNTFKIEYLYSDHERYDFYSYFYWLVSKTHCSFEHSFSSKRAPFIPSQSIYGSVFLRDTNHHWIVCLFVCVCVRLFVMFIKKQGVTRFFVLVHELCHTATFFHFGLVPAQFFAYGIQLIGNKKLFLGLFINKRQESLCRCGLQRNNNKMEREIKIKFESESCLLDLVSLK